MRSTVRDFEGRGLAGTEEVHRPHARTTNRKLAEDLAAKRAKFRADTPSVCSRLAAVPVLCFVRVTDVSIGQHCRVEMGRWARKGARLRPSFSGSPSGVAVRKFIASPASPD